MRAPDYVYKHFNPMKAKSLRGQLARTIRHNFPHVGGRRIAELCADMVLEVVIRHIHSRDSLGHGQLVWLGFAIDDPPARNKRSEDVRLVPVVLDLCTDEDLDAWLDRVSAPKRLLARCIRLFTQAHAQGALLSNVDLSCMLGVSESYVGQVIAEYERTQKLVVPRRATIHDVGSGVTHKRIICWKRFVEGKSPELIARETHHSLKSVDTYLGMFDRVRFCKQQQMLSDQIARVLGCTERLVKEYLEIDLLLESRGAS